MFNQNILGHVPAQGLSAVYGLVQFTTFEMLRNRMLRLSEVSHYEKSIDFACGAVAGCTAMTAAMPMDVLRTRLVAQGNEKVMLPSAANISSSYFQCAFLRFGLRETAKI